jgi:hypothetical protein
LILCDTSFNTAPEGEKEPTKDQLLNQMEDYEYESMDVEFWEGVTNAFFDRPEIYSYASQ